MDKTRFKLTAAALHGEFISPQVHYAQPLYLINI